MSETDEANESFNIPSTDPQEISEVRAKIIGMIMQHFYEDDLLHILPRLKAWVS